MCAVTSKLKKEEYSVLIENKDLSKGTLSITSRARADKILQIEKNLVLKSFATIQNKTFDEIATSVMQLVQRRKVR